VEAERAFLAALGGRCRSAVAARASSYPGGMMLSVQILSPDGVEVHEAEAELDTTTAKRPANSRATCWAE
jgi:porphobilinogen deaminase